jgi:hypothetical protein
MVGEPEGAIVIESDCVPSPFALVAFTVKLNVFAVVGVPEMVFPESVKPVGNVPLSMLHVIGVSPVAASVWLYAVPTAPLANDVVVIAGAVPVLFPGSTVVLSSPPPSPQAVKTSAKRTITAKILPVAELFFLFLPYC